MTRSRFLLVSLLLLAAVSALPFLGSERSPSAAAPTPTDQDISTAPAHLRTDSRLPTPARSRPEATGAWLRVEDARSAAPLARARVRFLALVAASHWQDASTDAAGRVHIELPARGSAVLLEVLAQGYAARAVRLDLAATETTIRLERAAACELYFHDGRGEPVRDLRLRLLLSTRAEAPDEGFAFQQANLLRRLASQRERLEARLSSTTGDVRFELPDAPPRVLETTGIEWELATDANGLVRWDALPPGDYRWQHVTPVALELLPPFERTRSVRTEDGLEIRQDVPHDLSGAFAIAAGETARYDILVRRSGVVTGQVDWGGSRPEGDAFVKLLTWNRSEITPGRGLSSRRVEAARTAGDDGSFRFEDVTPGHKLLRATWRSVGQHFHFAFVEFTLEEGEERDLGLLRSLQGEVFSGIVTMEDKDGSPVAAAPLFRSEELALATVNFSATGSKDVVRLTDSLQVRFDEPFHLLGIYGGDVRLWASFERGSLLRPDEIWEGPAAIEAAAPQVEPESIVFRRISAEIPVHVRASFPAGVPAHEMKAHFYSPTRGRVFRLRLFPDAAGSSVVSGSIALPSEVLEVWITPNLSRGWTEPGTGHCHTGRFDTTTQTQLHASLVPAAGLNVSWADGVQRKRRLALTPAAWREGGSGLLITPHDASGTYRFVGVPSETELLVDFGRTTTRSGPPGTVTELVLRSD